MDDQTSQSLSAFKDEIAAEVRPLIPGLSDPEDRFYALMALLRDKWDDAMAKELFETAKQISNVKAKVDALQSLMTEVSYHERDLEDEAKGYK